MSIAAAPVGSEANLMRSFQAGLQVRHHLLSALQAPVRCMPLTYNLPHRTQKPGSLQGAEDRDFGTFTVQFEKIAGGDSLFAPEPLDRQGPYAGEHGPRFRTGTTAAAAVGGNLVFNG